MAGLLRGEEPAIPESWSEDLFEEPGEEAGEDVG